MSATPRDIGTLVVVILKAQHLPNKQKIGKQDPYCAVTLNGDKRRTRAIKRGGQHPEWDEEVRFTLLEDTDDASVRSNANDSANGSPPPPPQKEPKRKKGIKGGNIMHVACYADDPVKPELIGEATVDLAEVLTKGETDDWFTLYNKDKFSGEVYLELTFWSNEKPPEAERVLKSSKAIKQYGGPGSYVPPDIEGSASQLVRSSSSLAQLNLYIPPYESSNAKTVRGQQVGAMVDRVTDEFGGISMGSGRPQKRRESFPLQHSHTHPSDLNNPSLRASSPYSFGRNVESGSSQQHDSPTTPVPRQGRHFSLGGSTQTYAAYRSPYETPAPDHPSGYSPSQLHSQSDPHSTYNLRSVSTGFLPVTAPAIASTPTGQLTSSGFVTPSQTGYPGNPPQQMPIPYSYGSPPPQTPVPSGFFPQHTYHQSSVAPNYSAYQYGSAPIHSTSYQPPAPTMAPSVPHPQQIPNMSPSISQVPQQELYLRGTPSPPQMSLQAYNPSPPVMASRPLPTPGVQNGNYATSALPHTIIPTPPRGVSPSHGVFMHNNTAQTPPPAPPQTYTLPAPPGPQAQSVMTVGPTPVQSFSFVPPAPPQIQPRAHGTFSPPPASQHYQMQQQSIQSIDQLHGSINIPIRPPLPRPPGGGSTLPLPPPSLIHHTTGFQPPPPPPPMLNRRSVSVSYPQSPYSHLPPPPPIPPLSTRNVKPGEIFNHGPPPQPPAQLSYESNADYWSPRIH